MDSQHQDSEGDKEFSVVDLDVNALENSVLLIDAAETEDEIGAVLRVHLALERVLTFYVAGAIPKEARHLMRMPGNFSGKLAMATGLGLPLPIATACQHVNKIRNKLAHEAGDTLHKKDIDNLMQAVNAAGALEETWTSVERQSLELTQKRPGVFLKYGEQGSRIDFILCSMSLYGAMLRWVITHAALKCL